MLFCGRHLGNVESSSVELWLSYAAAPSKADRMDLPGLSGWMSSAIIPPVDFHYSCYCLWHCQALHPGPELKTPLCKSESRVLQSQARLVRECFVLMPRSGGPEASGARVNKGLKLHVQDVQP